MNTSITTATPTARTVAMRLATVLLTIATAAALMTAGATPAHAGASGCASYGPSAGRWASGSMCTTVTGSGRFVSEVGTSFASAGNICNWDVSAEFFDTDGRWYETRRTGRHHGCTHNSGDALSIRRYMRRGTVCSTLRTNGARVQSVCHSIY